MELCIEKTKGGGIFNKKKATLYRTITLLPVLVIVNEGS